MFVPPLTGMWKNANGAAAIPDFSPQHPVLAVLKRVFRRLVTGCLWSKMHI